jgi:hypothetical protein
MDLGGCIAIAARDYLIRQESAHITGLRGSVLQGRRGFQVVA